MPADIREYLLDRFKTDATTLRQRAASLMGVKKQSPGPDAVLSSAMASACETVVAMVEQLPEHAPVDEMISALNVLVPKLTALANGAESMAAPAIRSVYMGACTRVQELIAAESNSVSNTVADDNDDFEDDELLDDVNDADDDDVDDDDLYDDQHEDHRS